MFRISDLARFANMFNPNPNEKGKKGRHRKAGLISNKALLQFERLENRLAMASLDLTLNHLKSVRNLWTSNSPYNLRVQQVRQGSGNPSAALAAYVSVFVDLSVNTMTGNEGRDWFFQYEDLDILTDHAPNELIDIL